MRRARYLPACFASILFMVLLQTPAYGTFYFGYDKFGDMTWHDAEKSPSNTEDDLLCWAAAASNILDWTGWGNAIAGANQDTIFKYYQDHWTDQGGIMEYAWQWWFSGVNGSQGAPGWSQVDVPGGNFYPTYDFSDYYHSESQDSFALSAIDQYLHSGYGVTLAVYRPDGAHAITCWGYRYDANGNYLGIAITDSDNRAYLEDPPDEMYYYGVAYSGDRWYLQNYYGTSDWYIGEVMALDQRPVPEPATMLLLASGLLGLAGLRRRRARRRPMS